MKLWEGRFSKEIDKKTNDFNSSISFDCRMYRQDITGSMAHAAMLGKQGIISKEESEKIIEKSRFITYSAHVESEEEGKEFIAKIKEARA